MENHNLDEFYLNMFHFVQVRFLNDGVIELLKTDREGLVVLRKTSEEDPMEMRNSAVLEPEEEITSSRLQRQSLLETAYHEINRLLKLSPPLNNMPTYKTLKNYIQENITPEAENYSYDHSSPWSIDYNPNIHYVRELIYYSTGRFSLKVNTSTDGTLEIQELPRYLFTWDCWSQPFDFPRNPIVRNSYGGFEVDYTHLRLEGRFTPRRQNILYGLSISSIEQDSIDEAEYEELKNSSNIV